MAKSLKGTGSKKSMPSTFKGGACKPMGKR